MQFLLYSYTALNNFLCALLQHVVTSASLKSWHSTFSIEWRAGEGWGERRREGGGLRSERWSRYIEETGLPFSDYCSSWQCCGSRPIFFAVSDLFWSGSFSSMLRKKVASDTDLPALRVYPEKPPNLRSGRITHIGLCIAPFVLCSTSYKACWRDKR